MAPQIDDTNDSRYSQGKTSGVIVAGAIAAWTVTALLIGNGILKGIPALLIGAVALLLIPTARNLSARVFINSVLVCGLTYLVWLAPLPTSGITHGGLLLSYLVAAAVWSIASSRRGQLKARIRPEVAATDMVMVLLATITSVASLTYWFKARTPELAYGILSGPWDNTSHYSMVVTLHQYQDMIFNLGPAADGSPRSFYSYPAGYHTVAASIMDLLHGIPAPQPEPLPVVFVMTVGIVLAFGYFIVAAGIASLPIIREAGAWGYFAISTAMGVLAFGPGIIAAGDGHYNFSYAIVMVLAASLAAIGLRRIFSPLQAATVLTAILCAGGAWLPMGVLAAGLSIVVFIPWRRSRWLGTPAERVAVILVAAVVLTVTGITIASQYLGGTTVSSLTTRGGGVAAASAVLPPLTAATLAMLSLIVRTPASRISRRPSVRRASWTSALLAGLILVFFVVESIVLIRAEDAYPAYYPQKALNGITAIAMVIAGLMIAIIAAERTPLPGSRPLARRTIAAAMCVIGIVPLAMSFTGTFSRAGLGDIPGRLFSSIETRPDLTAACRASLQIPPEKVAVIVTGHETDTLICATDRGVSSWEAWYVNDPTKKLTGYQLVKAAEPWLDDGGAVLVVAPDSLDRYRALVGAGADEKVIAWDEDPNKR